MSGSHARWRHAEQRFDGLAQKPGRHSFPHAGAEPERKIPVEWASESGGSFYASIKILVYDRVNMLGEIASVIGEMNVSIKAAQVQTDDRSRISTLKLTLDVQSREQMDHVIQAIRNKADVLDVYRITG